VTLQPRDPDYERRVRASFARQAFMATLGARLLEVGPGVVAIELPFRADLTQQHGFLHAAVVAAIADSACGYAALSLMAPGVAVLSVEFKINLLAPARGARFVARAAVTRAGRTITVTTAEVLAFDGREGDGVLVAAMLGTMMAVPARDGLAD
jgi:uncharacterized protein (TIGR00369 family)